MRFDDSERDETVPFPTVDEKDFRVVGLYGPLTDKKGAEIVFSMMGLRHTGERTKYNLTEEQEKALEEAQARGDETFTFPEEEVATEIIYEPFDFVISTPGGVALEMLAIYDVMKDIQKTMEIHTIGHGKVFSAGVPLLAAGTKGKRKIGAHCRVMIHSVLGGTMGNVHDIEVEADEIKYMQAQYVKILLAESKMTEEQIHTLLNTRTNCYLSAEEAVEYGIADEII